VERGAAPQASPRRCPVMVTCTDSHKRGEEGMKLRMKKKGP